MLRPPPLSLTPPPPSQGVSVKVCGLSESLQPLMWKHPSKNRSHGNMLLWVLNIVTEHLLTPDNLSTGIF